MMRACCLFIAAILLSVSLPDPCLADSGFGFLTLTRGYHIEEKHKGMGLELGGCARFKKSEFGLICCLGASMTALRPTPPSEYYDHPCPDPNAEYLGVYREPELEAYISMGPSLANFSLSAIIIAGGCCSDWG
jgi:hypothetical protein